MKAVKNVLRRQISLYLRQVELELQEFYFHQIDDLNQEWIANSSDLVGRNLMLHPLGYIEGHFREDLKSNSGPQGCCILSQEFYDSDIKRGFHRGYTFQIIRGPLPVEAALNLTSRKLVNFGKEFFKEFNSIYNHTAHMTVITEDLPELK